MSLASVAAQQTNAATAGTTTGTSQVAPASGTALKSLTSNFGDFLKLLMTQLQNQDPTSPLDTNQFTTELVQFASVEQQISTNTSMTKLVELTQAGEVMQASAMMGKQVTAASDHVPLQNGKATIQYTSPAAGAAAVAIYTEDGTKLRDVALTATKGKNSWTWDGKDGSGRTLPDGAYKIAVAGTNVDGTTGALPFSITGTATGVAKQGTDLQLELGALAIKFTAIEAVGG